MHPSRIPSMSELPAMRSIGGEQPPPSPRLPSSSQPPVSPSSGRGPGASAAALARAPSNTAGGPPGHRRSVSDGAVALNRQTSNSAAGRPLNRQISSKPPAPTAPPVQDLSDFCVPRRTKRQALRPRTDKDRIAEDEEEELGDEAVGDLVPFFVATNATEPSPAFIFTFQF